MNPQMQWDALFTDAKHADVVDHLWTLRRYASVCREVVEFGTHNGSTAAALLMGRPYRFATVDLVRQPEVDDLEALARALGVQFHFIEGNTADCRCTTCDMLFIDSRHEGEHLRAELHRHAPHVRRYILMHDTETYGQTGRFGGLGLWSAISEFLTGQDGRQWQLTWHKPECHGLTLLTRSWDAC